MLFLFLIGCTAYNLLSFRPFYNSIDFQVDKSFTDYQVQEIKNAADLWSFSNISIKIVNKSKNYIHNTDTIFNGKTVMRRHFIYVNINGYKLGNTDLFFNVILHQLGYVMGLGISNYTDSVMNLPSNNKRLQLSIDDILGILELKYK